MKRKIGLYILSLWLMFALIIIITIKIPVYFGDDWEYIETKQLVSLNLIPIICIVAIIAGFFAYYDFSYRLKGTAELAFQITEIENIDYEHLTFLTTYIVPLVCFNFDNERYQIVLLILLVIIGIIYIRTDLFYANPTLAVLKFRIYKVSGTFVRDGLRNNIIIITREKLTNKDKVKYLKLDNRIYYVKKIINEQK
ncbi:anti-phage protein KwaA [Sphingobacterium siyangense]|uniref:anti-phage protein KwaA n=1 Tax=Sphingobacterium siyangense TaxID=459529 RepID=UPI003DA3DD29